MQENDPRLAVLLDSPYNGDHDIAAPRLVPHYQIDSPVDLAKHGELIVRAMHRVLIYWTPERVDAEASHRSSDTPGCTRISREVAAFTVFITNFVNALAEQWVHARLATPDMGEAIWSERARNLSVVMYSALEALERRASAAESRATDLRLRTEFAETRSVIAARKLASDVVAAVEVASRNPEDEERLRQLVMTLEQSVRDLEATRRDNQFVADAIMEKLVAPDIQPRAQVALKKLASIATGETIGAILVAVAKGLGGTL